MVIMVVGFANVPSELQQQESMSWYVFFSIMYFRGFDEQKLHGKASRVWLHYGGRVWLPQSLYRGMLQVLLQ
jgi:hypothetical protein